MSFLFQEDKAELKAHSYLLEKEKSSLELQLSSKQSQEQAYLVQIDHLKSEVKELAARLGKHTKRQGSRSHSGDVSRVYPIACQPVLLWLCFFSFFYLFIQFFIIASLALG